MTAIAPIAARLNPLGVRFTTTALELPGDLRFNHWRNLGEDLARLSDANRWHLADWAAYGERTYRRDYGPALETAYTRDGIQNLAYVARNVEPSRRRDDLSFSHHVEVAPLEPEWQTAFLQDAFEKNWTRDELRDQIRAWRNHDKPARPPALTIRAAGELYDLCARAAAHAGTDPAAWAAAVLEHAARTELETALEAA